MALRTQSNLDAFNVFPVPDVTNEPGARLRNESFFPVASVNVPAPSGTPSGFHDSIWSLPSTPASIYGDTSYNATEALMNAPVDEMGWSSMYGRRPAGWRPSTGLQGHAGTIRPEYFNEFPTGALTDPYNPAYAKYIDFSTAQPITGQQRQMGAPGGAATNPLMQMFGGGGGAAPNFAQMFAAPTGGAPAGGAGSALPSLQPYGATSPQAARGGIDQFLANQANQMKYLEQIAQGGQGIAPQISSNPDVSWLRGLIQNGQPLDATQAWQAMVAAQERNVQRNAQNLREAFNASGNRVSSAYGDTMTDYFNQASKEQNALLGQMQLAAMEAERGRQFQGGTFLAGLAPSALQSDAQRQAQAAAQLGQFAFQGPSQLSAQDLQSYMQANNLAFQGSALQAQLENQRYLADLNNAFSASMYGAQGADQAAQQLLQNSMFAGNTLLNNAVNAGNQLYNTENLAALQLFGAQNQMLPQLINQQLQAQGLGVQAALGLGGLYNQNLGTGAMLGGQQYNLLQDAINRQYQESIRTSPFYHPYLQYLTQMSMFQPSMYFPQYTQSGLSQIAGLAGAFLPFLLGGFGGGGGSTPMPIGGGG